MGLNNSIHPIPTAAKALAFSSVCWNASAALSSSNLQLFVGSCNTQWSMVFVDRLTFLTLKMGGWVWKRFILQVCGFLEPKWHPQHLHSVLHKNFQFLFRDTCSAVGLNNSIHPIPTAAKALAFSSGVGMPQLRCHHRICSCLLAAATPSGPWSLSTDSHSSLLGAVDMHLLHVTIVASPSTNS